MACLNILCEVNLLLPFRKKKKKEKKNHQFEVHESHAFFSIIPSVKRIVMIILFNDKTETSSYMQHDENIRIK